MRVLTFARRIAHSEGIKPVKNVDLEYAIWERTGYPAFFRPRKGETSLDVLERQLRTEFRRWKWKEKP